MFDLLSWNTDNEINKALLEIFDKNTETNCNILKKDGKIISKKRKNLDNKHAKKKVKRLKYDENHNNDENNLQLKLLNKNKIKNKNSKISKKKKMGVEEQLVNAPHSLKPVNNDTTEQDFAIEINTKSKENNLQNSNNNNNSDMLIKTVTNSNKSKKKLSNHCILNLNMSGPKNKPKMSSKDYLNNIYKDVLSINNLKAFSDNNIVKCPNVTKYSSDLRFNRCKKSSCNCSANICQCNKLDLCEFSTKRKIGNNLLNSSKIKSGFDVHSLTNNNIVNCYDNKIKESNSRLTRNLPKVSDIGKCKVVSNMNNLSGNFYKLPKSYYSANQLLINSTFDKNSSNKNQANKSNITLNGNKSLKSISLKKPFENIYKLDSNWNLDNESLLPGKDSSGQNLVLKDNSSVLTSKTKHVQKNNIASNLKSKTSNRTLGKESMKQIDLNLPTEDNELKNLLAKNKQNNELTSKNTLFEENNCPTRDLKIVSSKGTITNECLSPNRLPTKSFLLPENKLSATDLKRFTSKMSIAKTSRKESKTKKAFLSEDYPSTINLDTIKSNFTTFKKTSNNKSNCSQNKDLIRVLSDYYSDSHVSIQGQNLTLQTTADKLYSNVSLNQNLSKDKNNRTKLTESEIFSIPEIEKSKSQLTYAKSYKTVTNMKDIIDEEDNENAEETLKKLKNNDDKLSKNFTISKTSKVFKNDIQDKYDTNDKKSKILKNYKNEENDIYSTNEKTSKNEKNYNINKNSKNNRSINNDKNESNGKNNLNILIDRNLNKYSNDSNKYYDIRDKSNNKTPKNIEKIINDEMKNSANICLIPQETLKTHGCVTLKGKMLAKLSAARFRYLNEKISERNSYEILDLFMKDKNSFHAYHKGFKAQCRKWNSNPVDIVIDYIKNRSANLVVVDFGCGDAKIAATVKNKVYSFDVVALNSRVIVSDMAHVPLKDKSADIAVYCLSLMGKNLVEILSEGNRVLKNCGTLLIVEVKSRFPKYGDFVRRLKKLGFKLINMNDTNKMFVWFEFKKIANVNSITNMPEIELKPSAYMKRQAK